MRLTQLRSFHAVAVAGSFTAAAERLHVSQPTVTTQVRLLEDLYNVRLFHRAGRRVQLTDVGEQLLRLSLQMFSLETDAVQLLKDSGELKTGQLRVAAVGPHHVTNMLRAFNARYPGMKVSVTTGNSQQALDSLLDYSADVAVLAQVLRDERFVSMPFGEHPVVIFTSTSHRFAKRRSISIADLEGERLILREQGSTTRKAIESAMKKANVTAEVVMEIGSREIIREAVALDIGIAAVSSVEFVPGPGLHKVDITDSRIQTFAHVLCLAERRETRLMRAFFDAIEADRKGPLAAPRARR